MNVLEKMYYFYYCLCVWQAAHEQVLQTRSHILVVVLACQMQWSEVLSGSDVDGNPVLHQQLHHLVMAM